MGARKDASRTLRIEAFEVAGRWFCRLVCVSSDEENLLGEPWVLVADFRTLDLVGDGWQTEAVLLELHRVVSAANRDGYE